MSKPSLYAVVTAHYPATGEVSGVLYDEIGKPIYGHVSSDEGWLWLDLTTNFPVRRKKLEERYPQGFDVKCIGVKRTAEQKAYLAELHELWDINDPGWQNEVENE